MSWLHFLGKRRPSSLEDQGNYKEVLHENRPEPKKHKNPKDVQGTRLSKANRQKPKGDKK